MEALIDALRSPNVRAFLRAIRLGEGTSDDAGYRRLFGGGDFESFADHPRVRTYEKHDGQFIRNGKIDFTTAAGAYQITASTWDEVRARYGLPDFSPTSQDLAAVGLLIRRKALDDVIAGRIEAAIAKCRLEWASLPGSPYGQRTESMQRVLDTYVASGGAFAPAPSAAPPTPQQIATSPQSIPVEAHPMTPFIAAALPALVQQIPELIRSFGDGKVTERNAKAAEAVLQIAQQATNTPNAQAAIEAVQSDPAALEAARAALERDHWLEATEAGGGGIAGAREFNLQVSDGNPLMMPALWISVMLLIPVYVVVGAVVLGDGWSAEVRIQVVTAVLATMGIVGAFWLGSSFAKSRQQQ